MKNYLFGIMSGIWLVGIALSLWFNNVAYFFLCVYAAICVIPIYLSLKEK